MFLSIAFPNEVLGTLIFDIQNEYHDNRTRFGAFRENKFKGLFWTYLGSSTFGPQNFCQEVSVWSGNLLTQILSEKKWTRYDLLIPQIPTLEVLAQFNS
jgi:hypothetical protein